MTPDPTTAANLPQFKTVDEAQQAVLQIGFRLPANARTIDEESLYTLLPLDSSTPQQLSEMLAYWTQMTNWAYAELSRAKGMVSAAEEQMKDRKAELIAGGDLKRGVTDRTRDAERHGDVLALKRNYLLVSNYARQVEAIADGYERNYRAVSRQIALATGEYAREMRGDSFDHMKPNPRR